MNRFKENGFTLVELMIATSIFSLILLMVASTSLQIGKLYYKGVNSARAQNAAREIIEDIGRTIQFGGTDPTPFPPVTTTINGMPMTYFCIDTVRYTYIVDIRNAAIGGYVPGPNGTAPHVLWRDTIPSSANCTEPANISCSDPNIGPPQCTPTIGEKGRELVPFNMKLTEFFLQEAPGSTGSRFWCLRVGVAFGEDDIHVRGNTQDCLGNTVANRVIQCIDSSRGGQFCGVSKLQTTIFRRLQ